MTGFDFLHDARPEALERIRTMRISERLVTPLWVALTILVVTGAVRGILTYRLDQAVHESNQAQQRFQTISAALARTKLERTRLEDLVELDRRLRSIHLSGSLLSLRLADIANHIPRRAWLTSIAKTPSGITVAGQAEGVRGLGETVTTLMTSRTVEAPALVRASDAGRLTLAGILSFQLQLKERAP